MPQLKYYGLQAVILPDTPPEKINGILIPETARKPTNTGVIVSVSPDSGFKKGDHVFYNHRTGYMADEYLSINYNFIYGHIKNECMQPIHARVLIEPIKKHETLTEGGVVLLEDKSIAEGKVIATGNGTHTEPMVIEVGDTVLYPVVNTGKEIRGLLILNQSEILAFDERQPIDEPND